MEHIIFPTQEFDFSKVSLQNPEVIQGGSYFCKLLCDDNDFLLQTPKCYTKNGIITTGKKIYSDLRFSEDNETFFNWLQHLEKHLHKLLYEKKDVWFQNEMTLDDIEYLFSNSYRSYKNGFLIRTFLKQSRNFRNVDNFIVYDDNENKLGFDDVSKEDNVISILQITGIKFNDNDFKLEFSLKQMMVFKNAHSFSKCLIKHNSSEQKLETTNLPVVETLDTNEKNIESISFEVKEEVEKQIERQPELQIEPEVEVELEPEIQEHLEPQQDLEENSTLEENLNLEKTEPSLQVVETVLEPETDNQNTLEKESSKQHLLIPQNKNQNNDFSLKEINLEIPSNDEPIVLKQPSEVYLEIYKTTLEKAKEAKELALRTFLEAQNIKNTYLLDESESFFDEQEFLEGLVEN